MYKYTRTTPDNISEPKVQKHQNKNPMQNARVLQIVPLRIHTEVLFSPKGISYLSIPLIVFTSSVKKVCFFFKQKSLNVFVTYKSLVVLEDEFLGYKTLASKSAAGVFFKQWQSFRL